MSTKKIDEAEIVNETKEIAETNNKGVLIKEESSALVMVASAVANGAGGDEVDKMIDLIKFNDSREAEKEFNIAFTEAQSEFPTIVKDKKGHNSMYASYDTVVKSIRPVLQKNGLSFRHDIDVQQGLIVVTCYLAHRKGHAVTAKLLAEPDKSGNKQAIQATASTVSYLKRYTLESVTGVSTSDEDTDGYVKPNLPVLTKKQADDMWAYVQEHCLETNLDRILNHGGVSKLEELLSSNYTQIMNILKQAAEAKEK